jgi:hypothetical protein
MEENDINLENTILNLFPESQHSFSEAQCQGGMRTNKEEHLTLRGSFY